METEKCPEGQRQTKGGGGTQGRGKHAIKPLPKNGFGPPPLMIRFPCSRNVIFHRVNGLRPDKSHFLRPPKLDLEGHFMVRFPPPPPKSHDTFCPPPFANSQEAVPSPDPELYKHSFRNCRLHTQPACCCRSDVA